MSLFVSIKRFFGFSSQTPALAPGDRILVCEDCKTSFVFDAGEQRFFKEKGFTDPKRCPQCRKKVRFRMRHRGRAHGHGHNHNQSHNNSHQQQRGPAFFRRKNGVVDGESPYVDER